jgi:hypothetical protein
MTCDRLKAWAPDTTLDCTDSDTINAFNAMQLNLLKEIEMRDDLQSWFYTDLTQLLDGVENNQIVDLATDYQNALAFTAVDQKKTVGMEVMTIIGDVLTTAAGAVAIFAAVPVIDMPPQMSKAGAVSGGLGVIAGLVSLGKDIWSLTHPEQQDNLPGEVKDAAVNLWKDMVSQYINTQANLDQAFLLITSDWGRMQALHQIYSGLYDKSQYLNVLQAMQPGINAGFYQTLLPVVFTVEAMPYDFVNPKSSGQCSSPCSFYVCEGSSSSHKNYEECPSGGRPADSLLSFINLWYADNDSTALFSTSNYTVWKGNSGSTSNYYDDTNINLFKPVSQGGFGVSKYDFAARWPFTYSFPSHWDEACDCSPVTRPCPPQN